MVLREELEKREYSLAPQAAKADQTRGRAVEEVKDPLRTDFQRDRDRIIHSKSFRRLMHKTQVFMAPEGDHFRTRLTHTLEVSQIARTIARALNLNEDLTEAIAMGHDLGHTPFGHSGERNLDEIHPGGFQHNVQSLRVVDVLETRTSGAPMNLTAEVRDGIVNHSGDGIPFTLEGKIVRISDRVAYINHDIDDAIRAGIITEADLPQDCVKVLGESHGDRITYLVMDLIKNSESLEDITQSEEAYYYMNKLRSFMFEIVYSDPRVRQNEDDSKIYHVMHGLYEYYMEHPLDLPREHIRRMYDDGINEVVKDYIAGMTDRYAIYDFNRRFVPTAWTINN